MDRHPVVLSSNITAKMFTLLTILNIHDGDMSTSGHELESEIGHSTDLGAIFNELVHITRSKARLECAKMAIQPRGLRSGDPT